MLALNDRYNQNITILILTKECLFIYDKGKNNNIIITMVKAL